MGDLNSKEHHAMSTQVQWPAMQAQVERLCRDVCEMKDQRDPVAWEAVAGRVWSDGDTDHVVRIIWRGGDIFSDRPAEPIPTHQAAEFQKFLDDYKDWKRLLRPLITTGRLHLNWRAFSRTATLLTNLTTTSMGVYGYRVAAAFAAEHLRAVPATGLTEAEQLNDRGYELHGLGRYAEALNYHEEAIRLSPKFPLAWINKGIALKNLGKYSEAIGCYDHVLNSLDPECIKALYNKANTLITIVYASGVQSEAGRGLYEQALALVEQILRIDPDDTESLALQARLRNALRLR